MGREKEGGEREIDGVRDRETEGEGIKGGETQRIRSEKTRYVKRYREKSFQKFKFK